MLRARLLEKPALLGRFLSERTALTINHDLQACERTKDNFYTRDDIKFMDISISVTSDPNTRPR